MINRYFSNFNLVKFLQKIVAVELSGILVLIIGVSIQKAMTHLIFLPVELGSSLLYGCLLVSALGLFFLAYQRPLVKVVDKNQSRVDQFKPIIYLVLQNFMVFLLFTILFGEALHFLSDQKSMFNIIDHSCDVVWKLSTWVYTGLNAFEQWTWSSATLWGDIETVRITLKGWIEGWASISPQVSLTVWSYIGYCILHICHIWVTFYYPILDWIVKGRALGTKPHSTHVEYPTKFRVMPLIRANLLRYGLYATAILLFYLWISVPPISPHGPTSVAMGIMEGLSDLIVMILFLAKPLAPLAPSPEIKIGLSWLAMIVIYNHFVVFNLASNLVYTFPRLGVRGSLLLSLAIFICGFILLVAVAGIVYTSGIFMLEAIAYLPIDIQLPEFSTPNPIAYSPDEAGGRSWSEWWSGSTNSARAPRAPSSPVEGLRQISSDLHQQSNLELANCSRQVNEWVSDPSILDDKSPNSRHRLIRAFSEELNRAVHLSTVAEQTHDTALVSLSASQSSATVTAVVAENLSKPVGEALGEVIKHKTGTK